ncbi:hypothetical protein HanIR_Chr09g0442981 [Helianthus annuus]|nr:hypothetical protein HanIR_Chr09g0442981 [Helianthus annuus]
MNEYFEGVSILWSIRQILKKGINKFNIELGIKRKRKRDQKSNIERDFDKQHVNLGSSSIHRV